MGKESAAVAELRELFELAEAYGLSDWLVLDLSVVRGLAYYTGVVFEVIGATRSPMRCRLAVSPPPMPPRPAPHRSLPACPPIKPPVAPAVPQGFDRTGELRAIFGGGRYDKLLGSFGGEDVPAAGFGFGDAVIVELLKMKGLLPDLSGARKTLLVACQNVDLRPMAMGAASALREAGANVDMVLEDKKPKWVFKHADRTGAAYVLLFGPREAESGKVRSERVADSMRTHVETPGVPCRSPSLHLTYLPAASPPTPAVTTRCSRHVERMLVGERGDLTVPCHALVHVRR